MYSVVHILLKIGFLCTSSDLLINVEFSVLNNQAEYHFISGGKKRTICGTIHKIGNIILNI